MFWQTFRCDTHDMKSTLDEWSTYDDDNFWQILSRSGHSSSHRNYLSRKLAPKNMGSKLFCNRIWRDSSKTSPLVSTIYTLRKLKKACYLGKRAKVRQTNKHKSVLRSFARPQADCKLKNFQKYLVKLFVHLNSNTTSKDVFNPL